MGRRIIINFFLLIFSIISSVLLLETTLRIYNPVKQTVRGDTVAVHPNNDEVRHFSDVPGLQSEVHIHQNSLGFRGADLPADFADRLTIITIGGSTTRSPGQSDDRTWTALLGDAIAECFDRTWINNAGFDGHTSFAHVDLIRNYVNKLHPKVVVMLIGANEIFGDGARVVEYQNTNLYSGVKGFIKSIISQSEVANLGMTLYRSYRAWHGGLSLAILEEGDAMPSGGEAKLVAARSQQPAYTDRLRLIIRLLRDAQTIPVFVTQPTIGGTELDPTTGRELSRLRYGQFFSQAFDIFNDTMRHVAHTEQIDLIDLARSMPKDTRYYYDIMHYTDAGAKSVARLIAPRLLSILAQAFPSSKKDSCHIVLGGSG